MRRSNTRQGFFLRRGLRLAATAALVAAATVVVSAHDPFSLDISFGTSWNGVDCGGAGICGDAGIYSDLADGVDSWSDNYGNVRLDTTGSSSRSICLDFPDPTYVYDGVQLSRFVPGGLTSLNGCYSAFFHSLANNTYSVTDVGAEGGPASSQPTSAVLYFYRDQLQYELHWERVGFGGLPYIAPPLKVTGPDLNGSNPDRWILAPYSSNELPNDPDLCPNCQYTAESPEVQRHADRVSNKQPHGRVALANVVMPFALAADTAGTNLRATSGGGKGKKH